MNLAGWGSRVGASLIDGLPALALYGIGYFIMFGTDDAGNLTFNPLSSVFFLAAIVINGYNRWFQAGKTGQSWGKKALGLRLVSEQTGQPIGAGMAFVRDIAHVLDGFCFIGYLFPLWDQKKQTFSDKIIKTLVVS